MKSYPDPGDIVYTDGTKNLSIRYPVLADIPLALTYINTLSSEDTYITFSGEQLTLAEEAMHYENCLQKQSSGDMVLLHLMIGETLAGIASITRNTAAKKRSLHTGELAVSIALPFRGKGHGQVLLTTLIQEAKKHIHGLRSITLDVYSDNERGIKLYQSLGFKEYGREPEGIYRKGVYSDRVSMYLSVV